MDHPSRFQHIPIAKAQCGGVVYRPHDRYAHDNTSLTRQDYMDFLRRARKKVYNPLHRPVENT
jgi:hypothetical protein